MNPAMVGPENDFTIRMRWVDGRLTGELEIDSMGLSKLDDNLYQVQVVLVPLFGGEKLIASFGRPPQAPPPTAAAPVATPSPASGDSRL